jgi:hypothetical protein
VLLHHHACRNVVSAEGTTELSPRHLVVCGASGGVVGPPCARIATQLLRDEEGLLYLYAAQEPKHGFNHPKPVIILERLSCLGEERRVSSRKVDVDGRSWSGNIPCPIATTSRVGHSCRSNSVCLSRDSRIEAIASAKVSGGGGFPFP